ncbi:hypothetical protein HMPREF0762_01983 [Slackia exigua ATCC 700122]|uniref:Uncharacterized protein n=1 Tax=Slackia exigua (strain ATCC 700122 / DSM 15923 / CIP 105133 / JCM 11022 / KCTC 5966 / S-7) TaxID=649764 RepID=D0WJF6_SLAES|nr:hypothetical protein HMPREF0762_01983 [Slackia exigua ATCC 700122]
MPNIAYAPDGHGRPAAGAPHAPHNVDIRIMPGEFPICTSAPPAVPHIRRNLSAFRRFVRPGSPAPL